jgi:hypothetical protein
MMLFFFIAAFFFLAKADVQGFNYRPSALEVQLTDLSLVVRKSTHDITSAWGDSRITSMWDVCNGPMGVSVNSALSGENKSISSITCDDNGVIVIQMRSEDIDRSLRGSQFTLTPVFKNPNPELGLTDIERDETYSGTPAFLIDIFSFRCGMTFGDSSINVPQDFQYTQPPGGVIKIDLFSNADFRTKSNLGGGLSDYCNGVPHDALNSSEE